DRPPQKLRAPGCHPLTSRLQERLGCLGVVDRFEKSEKPGSLLVKLIVIAIDDGRDATYRAAIPPGDEKLGVRICVKRVLLAVQKLLDRNLERGYPMWISSIDRPRQLYEFVQSAFAADRCNFNRQSMPLFQTI